MEGKQHHLRDLRPETKPIEEIEARNQEILDLAGFQLNEIQGSLIDLTKKIEEEKPDIVVFLDKGARVLAFPIFKFLKSKMAKIPEIRFYNDDKLKGGYLNSTHELLKAINKDFVPHKGKKVFFVDETYSGGKGAGALSNAIEDSEVDGYYFALTRDPESTDEHVWHEDNRISYQQVQGDVNRLRHEGRVQIYNNDIGYLFTKDAASLYVMDEERGKTGSRYEIIPEEDVDKEYDYQNMRPPHSRKYTKEPNGMSWKEYDDRVRLSNLRTLRELKSMILETLERAA